MKETTKYFLVDKNVVQQDDLLCDIADFFWNNGSTVYISSQYNNNDIQKIIQTCDCIVLIDNGNISCMGTVQTFYEELNLMAQIDTKHFLIFRKNGVYTNVIPFPYKIFHFDSFNRYEFRRFFTWCQKLDFF